jgi:MraZ protein
LWGKVAYSHRMITGQKLYGEFDHAVDPKGRITLPARYREYFADGAVMVYLSGPKREKCLSVFGLAAWDEYDEKHIVPLDTFNSPDDDWTVRDVYEYLTEETPDKQGRVMLPANIVDILELSSKVKIIGARTHLEVWDPDHFAARKAERQAANA